MLDFSHSLVIGPFLFHLVPSVALRQGSVAIALRKGVEQPYIKKMRIADLSPRNSQPQCPALHRLLYLLSCV